MEGEERQGAPSPITIWHLVLGAPLVALGFVARTLIRDNSFLWHIRAGELQLADGKVLNADPFSFTALGERWLTQSWLAELGYAWLHDRFGLSFTAPMVYLASAAFLVGLMLVAFRATRSVIATGVFAVLSVLVSVAFLNPRPVLFSFLLFAVLVLADGDDRLRWSLPLILWVWAAVHGSFAIGGVYLVLQAVRRRRRSDLRAIVASGIAVSLTAHGVATWEILFKFAQSREALANISEWAHPRLLSVPLLPLFVAIVVLVWAGTKNELSPRDLWVVVPFLALAVSANRAVPPAWVGLAPFVPVRFAAFPVRSRWRGVSRPVAAGFLLVMLVIPLVIPREGGLDPARFPLEATKHLTEPRVFHDDGAGGYLIFAEWPQRLVYIDDRAELYGAERMSEFRDARGGRATWRETLDEHGIDQVMMKPGDPIVETLRLAGWTERYADEYFVVLDR